ncbi:acetoacetyl-CoA synthetase [Vibrio nigripulchritudo]|uniref:acetoacetate--CoA ligase n=1 Tax=Vibrio nigripulchritudo TaxID=28173 RepID=UPI00190BFF81|nr:acetoacetate--CoA ligase [Vibrio nigripulchritudo]BCL70199.1 acetoacetyl-CoA synthetase [Vibrio nigripulchritudo]BDU31549.1 acetoacetyl-CoA synthetase [Vibrio nigripulchritudo]
MMNKEILWKPSVERIRQSRLSQFAKDVGFDPNDYDTLHRWSVSDLGGFWSSVWDFCDVVGDQGEIFYVPSPTARMTGARFFPDAQLNLAENMLKGPDDEVVVFTTNESGQQAQFTRKDLRMRVAKVADGLRQSGVQQGDRVAGVQPNNVDALVALLSTVSIGAVWTSCSPDFGQSAIIDRIGQVEPKVLFVEPRYQYGGKSFDISDRINQVVEGIPSIQTIVQSGEGELVSDRAIRQGGYGSQEPLTYTRTPFDHPIYVLYTSGTTGAPKAIVHRVGGVLLQHLKEHVLHGDVQRNDRVMWYSNTAWMMYHWNLSALAAGAAIVLYDGAPILKTPNGLDCTPLWNLASDLGLTHLGVSPKYLATLAAEAFLPNQHYALSSLKSLMVCGAPTLPHQFDWVYQAIKEDMMFASISGGTEILGCFLIGSPVHPVYRGQLMVKALGHSIAALDDRDIPVIGERGELVCTEPFPSMPLTFWGEDGDKRYHDTYFGDRNEVWTHGDVVEFTYSGGGYVHGRSDNTLKPGGVRIGISEIYAVCEQYKEVDDYLAFGHQHDGDEDVVLCLKPAPGEGISKMLVAEIRNQIRQNASPRHVPARVHIVSDVPYTVNGKRVEGAARTVVAGGVVKNIGSIANQACLEEYRQLTRENAW